MMPIKNDEACNLGNYRLHAVLGKFFEKTNNLVISFFQSTLWSRGESNYCPVAPINADFLVFRKVLRHECAIKNSV